MGGAIAEGYLYFKLSPWTRSLRWASSFLSFAFIVETVDTEAGMVPRPGQACRIARLWYLRSVSEWLRTVCALFSIGATTGPPSLLPFSSLPFLPVPVAKRPLKSSRESGARCKLPLRGPRRKRGRKRISVYFKPRKRVCCWELNPSFKA